MDKPYPDSSSEAPPRQLAGHPDRSLRNVPAVLACLLAIAACSSIPPQANSAPIIPATANSVKASPAACPSSQLTLSLDAGDGRFDGMSHSGAALVLHHAGKATCIIPAVPAPVFTDAGNRKLNIVASNAPTRQTTSTSRLDLAGGRTVTSDMRWVSGNVYEHGHCESPAHIILAIGKQEISAPFSGHLCGAGGKPSFYTLTAFKWVEAASATATSSPIIYTCEDGRRLQAVYPDTRNAELTLAGKTYYLHTAVSADGARYVGDHWQWWTKGRHQAQLAPLPPGETMASTAGVACTAP